MLSRALGRVIAAVRFATNAAVVIVFGFMVLAVVSEIVGRNFGLRGSNAIESATFAQIWLTALGASVALRSGSMFALDTVTRHLPLVPARALSIAIAALSLVLIAVIFHGGLLLTETGFRQTSPVMRLPMWIVFVALPVGMALLALEVVLRVVERWSDPFALPEEDTP